MLGVLITIGGLMVGGLVVATIGGSMVDIGSGLVVGLGGNTSSESGDQETQPGLITIKLINLISTFFTISTLVKYFKINII